MFFFRMCLILHDYQSKASRYSNGLTYLKNRVTTNEKHTIDSQKQKEDDSAQYKRKPSNHKRKKKKKGTKKEYKINWKTRFKMAINTYLSIIVLNVSGINAPIKRHRVADWIKKLKKEPTICCL